MIKINLTQMAKRGLMIKYLSILCASLILTGCLITYEHGKTNDRIIKMEKQFKKNKELHSVPLEEFNFRSSKKMSREIPPTQDFSFETY